MVITRRELLGGLGAVLCLSQVPLWLPTDQESKGTILDPPKADYTLEVHVQKTGDRFSHDFYHGRTLFDQVLTNTRSFYADHGFTIEIRGVPTDGYGEGSDLDNRHGLFVYTTKEALLSDPERFISQNPEPRFDEMVRSEARVFATKSGLSFEDAYTKVRSAFETQAIAIYRRFFENKNAITNPDTHITYVFPSTKLADATNPEVVNHYSIVFVHELGHLLGLDESNHRRDYVLPYHGPNFMINTLSGRDADIHLLSMHPEQKRMIEERLSK